MEFVSGKLKFSTVKILCRKATDECVISVADRKLAENHRVTSELWSKICMVPHVLYFWMPRFKLMMALLLSTVKWEEVFTLHLPPFVDRG